MSDIQALMRSANPIVDAHTEFGPEDLDALLLLTQRRSGDMDLKEVTTPVTPEKKNSRGWLVAAVAFASVIAVAALAVLLIGPSDEAEPASPTTTLDATPPTTEGSTTTVVSDPPIAAEDQAVLDAFVAALNGGDVQAFRGLFDAGAERVGDWESSYDDDLDGLATEAEHKFLRGTSSTLEDCLPSGDRVNCKLVSEGPVELAIFQVPRRETYSFLIENGLILRIDAKCDVCSDGAETDGEIRNWVARFDPDARPVMGAYHADPTTVDSALLWRDYAPLWREAKSDGVLDETGDAMAAILAYEQAFNEGDSATLLGLFDEGAARIEFLEPGLMVGAGTLAAESSELHAQGTRLEITGCSLESEALRCTYTYSGPVPDALFRGPAVYTERIAVSDGAIVSWETRCAICPGIEMYEDVVAWVATQDAEAAARMGSQWYPKMTDGDPLLWLEWAPKWAEAGRP